MNISFPIQNHPLNSEAIQQQKHSFCKQKINFLNVAGRVGYSVLMALVHKVVAIATFAFPNFANRHHSFSSYHCSRAFCAWQAYRLFGNNLVNFGLNTTGKPKELGNDEEKILDHAYGAKVKEKYLALAPTDEADPKKLQAKEIYEGICQGISLDYLNRYLFKRAENVESLTAIQEVSQIFSENGNEEAQVLQIVSEALGLVGKHALDKLFENQNARLLKKQSEFEKKFIKATVKEQAEMIKELEKMVNQKQTASKDIDLMKKQFWGSKLELLIPKMKIQFAGTFSDQNKKMDSKKIDWIEHLKNLPMGAYYISLDYGKPVGHAILYVKDSNHLSFLHDPNLGTVQFFNDFDLLKFWQLIKKNYHAKGYCSLDFYQCTLKSE